MNRRTSYGWRKREITVYCGGGGGGCTWLHYVRCCRRRRRQRWRWLVIPMWGLFGAWFFSAGARAWNHGLCFVVFHYQFPLDCAMNHTQNSFLADLRVRWRHTVYILAHMSVLWMDELFFNLLLLKIQRYAFKHSAKFQFFCKNAF